MDLGFGNTCNRRATLRQRIFQVCSGFPPTPPPPTLDLTPRSPALNIHLLPSRRYEEEINRRTAAENEFVVLKKVRRQGCSDLTPGPGSPSQE